MTHPVMVRNLCFLLSLGACWGVLVVIFIIGSDVPFVLFGGSHVRRSVMAEYRNGGVTL